MDEGEKIIAFRFVILGWIWSESKYVQICLWWNKNVHAIRKAKFRRTERLFFFMCSIWSSFEWHRSSKAWIHTVKRRRRKKQHRTERPHDTIHNSQTSTRVLFGVYSLTYIIFEIPTPKKIRTAYSTRFLVKYHSNSLRHYIHRNFWLRFWVCLWIKRFLKTIRKTLTKSVILRGSKLC